MYSSCAASTHTPNPVYTMEMFMTSLDRDKASILYKTSSSSATLVTEDSGIRNILPNSKICGFEFDPCGYFMYAIEGLVVSTIHITPEHGFSYAKFRAVGYDPNSVSLDRLVVKVLNCFEPRELSIALQANFASKLLEKTSSVEVKGYCLEERTCEYLGMDGSIVYQKFVKNQSCESLRSVPKSCWKEEEKEEKEYE